MSQPAAQRFSPFSQQTPRERIQTLIWADRLFEHVTPLAKYGMHFMKEWRMEVRQLTCGDMSESYYRLRLCFTWDMFDNVLETIPDASPLVFQWFDQALTNAFGRVACTDDLDAEVQKLNDNPEWQCTWNRTHSVEFLLECVKKILSPAVK
jgi:hypothetical protein